jgi:imidazolonepropionase-like amidohydrolase
LNHSIKIRKMKKFLYIALTICMPYLCIAQVTMGDVLIKNGTLLTITKGILAETDILVEKGKIKRIGKNISAPSASYKVIDAKGMFVMPGIIDAHSHIGLDVVNEATSPVTSEVNVGDGIDPFDINVYQALAGGVTVSHAMHGSANAIGGQCQTIKHRYGTYNPSDFIMEGAPRTIKFALGENPIRVHGEGSGIVPRTRMGVEQIFRTAFTEASIYKQKWEDYNTGKAKDIPEYSTRMEVLRDILDGKIIIHCHSYRADEILMLMNVLKDFNIKKICFQHVNEGFKVAPELAAFGATASVFADWWAYKMEVYYSTAYNAAILTRNGVITSINSDSGELIRHLYHEAAKTQRYGNLTDEEALKLITINPAIQLGIDGRVGSLEVGKDGDIAIFDKHPLSIYAIPQFTIVDGAVKFDRKNDKIDMRIMANPDDKVTSSFIEYHSHDDRCMEGVADFLFKVHSHK